MTIKIWYYFKKELKSRTSIDPFFFILRQVSVKDKLELLEYKSGDFCVHFSERTDP
jgi:hypothetical protein